MNYLKGNNEQQKNNPQVLALTLIGLALVENNGNTHVTYEMRKLIDRLKAELELGK